MVKSFSFCWIWILRLWDFENILSWLGCTFYYNNLNICTHIGLTFFEFWILRLWNISYYRGFVEFYQNYLNILLNFCFPGSSPVQPCQGVVPAQPCRGISSHTATAWSFLSPTYISQTLAKPSGGLRIVAVVNLTCELSRKFRKNPKKIKILLLFCVFQTFTTLQPEHLLHRA